MNELFTFLSVMCDKRIKASQGHVDVSMQCQVLKFKGPFTNDVAKLNNQR